ncbi:MAG: hypothetical protein AAF961_18715 [Planctomycetota bacterium]
MRSSARGAQNRTYAFAGSAVELGRRRRHGNRQDHGRRISVERAVVKSSVAASVKRYGVRRLSYPIQQLAIV